MLDTIREIGIFMIAAQAVIHFAPGRQYEKYIKLISSVIILFLFMRPFISAQGNLEQEWRTGVEQMMQEYEEEDLWQESSRNTNDLALERLEEEIKSRLNTAIEDEEYCVNSVSLVFDGEADFQMGGEESELQFQKVVAVMALREKETISPVLVEDIVIGKETRQENGKEALRYQELFAGILGIGPEKVEVTCVGGW